MSNKTKTISFQTKIKLFIVKHQLMDDDEKYLLALSGGADSMALLTAIHSLGYNVEAVHCNFHLRGDESDRDEHFCIEQCQLLGIKIHLAHFDTIAHSKTHKVSFEMAARELRYSYFERLRHDIGAKGILVAHHQDDSVETILMNLIRGTGLHGLSGISPHNGYIIRPLLCVNRHEIENYLQDGGISYVTDSTNLTDDVVRNKIRLNVIPLLRTINPSVCNSIFSTSVRLSQAADIFDHAIRQDVEAATISLGERESVYNIDQIKNEYTLFTILQQYSFSPDQVEEIYVYIVDQLATGSVFMSSTHELLIDRGRLIIQTKEKPCKPLGIPETGSYVISQNYKLRINLTPINSDFTISKRPEKVCLDADGVEFPLKLRQVSAGDRFYPLGMRGSRLVSDFLTDLKKSLFEKRRQMVIEDATGKIIWVVGLRPDERCRISSNSKKALVLEICDTSN